MLVFDDLIAKLRARLLGKLPRKSAQLLMTSSSRINKTMFIPKNTKKSSVLILLYPDNYLVKTIFIQRPDYAGIHGGQISFPGGKFEKTDSDYSETAKREAFEEVGVIKEKIKILGSLTELFIPPSNYTVYPFIGYTDAKPDFIADEKEVAKIIQVNIFDFLNENNVILNSELEIGSGIKIKIPYYLIDGNIIWGATAMIMSEFVEILRTLPE